MHIQPFALLFLAINFDHLIICAPFADLVAIPTNKTFWLSCNNCTVCEATPGLVLPEERTSGLGCIPEGRTVSYQCTVQGGVVTVWIGSAINCSHTMPPRIVLEHHLFKANGVHSSCGLMAMSVSVNEITKEYTSRLIFTADTDLHAKTINCTKDFSEVVGFDSIKIGGMKHTTCMIMLACE